MREQHLDLLAEPARGAPFPRSRDLASHVASAFVDRARYSPRCLLGATARLQCASIAIALAGQVKHGSTIVHQCSGRGEYLAAGTAVHVTYVVIGEVLAREDPVRAGRLIEDGNVRLDAVLVNQPAEHLGRTIAAVAEEPAWIEIEPFERALNHALGGQHLRTVPDRSKDDRCYHRRTPSLADRFKVNK